MVNIASKAVFLKRLIALLWEYDIMLPIHQINRIIAIVERHGT